ncbi:MAG: LPS export ABC transporter ATP-binding protein [Pseudomonadales bacterium]|nr:LPS export ABC transporter ATP-binding protein [Pseudomonadales bacterium]MDP6470846.1 LPS export ABC transporter ATP-binding protein [Pseudomonadales bacterium]MDP6825969.1 LPS export ABC transporter ATP-binding protein [Pseudomonadales bacterium]MDP6972281.1 LPS export ABC transporter ATP-binding protein [Pseudomonadales bacterium]
MATLEARGLHKTYGSKIAVAGISLKVSSGEIVGLLGSNGAGKTTCFYMIVGLLAADDGDIRLDERLLTGTPMHVRARAGIGYLPQETSVFRRLSCEDNLMAILEMRNDLGAAERGAALEQLLKEFNLTGVRKSLGERLSGGERRRLEIARALASQPQFMLLDEPFAGVDPISVVDIKSEIRDLAHRGIGVLITDHNVRETLDICHRAYIVNEGHMIKEGPPADILADETVRSVYLGRAFRL